ncbi:MAG: class I SAM-dependent methyltransferase [Microcoleaceae cyanobacterium]
MANKSTNPPNWNQLIKDYATVAPEHALERRPELWIFGYIPEIELLSNYVDSNSKILDFGCGNGRISRYIKKQLGCQVVGIDLNPEAIARAKAFNDGIEYFATGKDEIPTSFGLFDGCVSNHVFPTYSTKEAIVASLKKIRQNLKSGSPIIVYVDNTNNTGVKYTSFTGGIAGEKYASGDPLPMKIYLGETEVMNFNDYFWSPDDYLEAINLAGYKDTRVIFPSYDVKHQKQYEEYFSIELLEEFENEKRFLPCAIYLGVAP